MEKITKYSTLIVADDSYEYDGVTVSDAASVADFLKRSPIRLADRPAEQIWVVMVDCHCSCIGVVQVSVGTLTGTIACARDIYRDAIAHNASGIIMVHNHPSGDCAPSKEDIVVAKNMAQAGDILGVRLLDSLIVSRRGYYSFADAGMFGQNKG